MAIKNVAGTYESFADFAKAVGCKPAKMKTGSQKKLDAQRKQFSKKHICRACGQPMTYNPNTNIMSCTNPNCKGIKRTKKDKDGNEVVYYEPSFEMLSDKGADIANVIFS